MIKIGNIELPDFPLLLAPMEDVSDPPFRRLCKMHGADLMYSEFISSEGLIRDAIKSRMKLDIFDYERPVGIQIFGGDEEAMALSSKIVSTVNPDLIDINFGCPVKKVVCKGAGAGVLKDVDLMVRLTKAVIDSTHLPVTVKTRLGWDDTSINIDEVAERLQDIGVAALSIHARTRAQMYKGHSDWSHIARVKNNPRITMPIFGNGDIDSPEKALHYKNEYGIDGIIDWSRRHWLSLDFQRNQTLLQNRRTFGKTNCCRQGRSGSKPLDLGNGMERRKTGNCGNPSALHQLFQRNSFV